MRKRTGHLSSACLVTWHHLISVQCLSNVHWSCGTTHCSLVLCRVLLPRSSMLVVLLGGFELAPGAIWYCVSCWCLLSFFFLTRHWPVNIWQHKNKYHCFGGFLCILLAIWSIPWNLQVSGSLLKRTGKLIICLLVSLVFSRWGAIDIQLTSSFGRQGRRGYVGLVFQQWLRTSSPGRGH